MSDYIIVPDRVGLGLELFDESNTSSRVAGNVESVKVLLVSYGAVTFVVNLGVTN
jgi:hypothetical protein